MRGPRRALRRLPHRAPLRSAHRRAHAAVVGRALGARGERARAGPRRRHRRHGDERHRVPRGHRARRSARSRAKDGVFVSMGNHDYFGDGEPLISLLRQRGVRVLRNEGRARAAAERVYLAAIDDTWTRRDDLDARAARARPDGAPTVLLAHDPDELPQRPRSEDVDLTLSGHTHGGQIAVPFLAREARLARSRTTTTSALPSGRRRSTCTPVSARRARRCASASRRRSSNHAPPRVTGPAPGACLARPGRRSVFLGGFARHVA